MCFTKKHCSCSHLSYLATLGQTWIFQHNRLGRGWVAVIRVSTFLGFTDSQLHVLEKQKEAKRRKGLEKRNRRRRLERERRTNTRERRQEQEDERIRPFQQTLIVDEDVPLNYNENGTTIRQPTLPSQLTPQFQMELCPRPIEQYSHAPPENNLYNPGTSQFLQIPVLLPPANQPSPFHPNCDYYHRPYQEVSLPQMSSSISPFPLKSTSPPQKSILNDPPSPTKKRERSTDELLSDLLRRLQISEKSKSNSAKQINSELGKSENEEEIVISARSLKDPLSLSEESSKRSPHDERLEEASVPDSRTSDTSISLKAKQSLALDALVDRLSKLNQAVSSVRDTRTVKQLVSFTKKQQKEEDTVKNQEDSKAILVKSTLEYFKTTKSDEQREKSENDEGKESSRKMKESK